MKKRLLAMLLALATMTSLLAACGGTDAGTTPPTGGNNPTTPPAKTEPIILEYPTFQVGVNTSAPVMKQLVEEFNAANEGKIKVVVEEVPGDSNYVEKMKILMSNNELPPVVFAGGYNLLDMALSKNLVVDLTDVVNADPEWKAMLDDVTIAVNSRDGKLYSLPGERSVIPYYYNEELFQKAGISAPATTWDEFFAQCDKLLAAGITPLALDTADSAWVSTLWLGALVATQNQAGFDFMQTMMPMDYNTPEMIKGMDQLAMMLQKYTTKDAVGGKYEHAANNFLSGQAAMIANGSWMMGDFADETKAPAGFADKVKVAIYPGDFIFNDPMLGFFVTKQKDPAVEAAAIEFVKYVTSAHGQEVALEIQGMVPASSEVEISDAARTKFPLLAQIVEATQTAKVQSKYLQATMYPNLLDVISQEFPNLASGKLTGEQMCTKLTEAAKKNQ